MILGNVRYFLQSYRNVFLPLLVLTSLMAIYLNGTLVHRGLRGSASGYGFEGNSSYLFDVGYAWKEGNINDFLFNGQDIGGIGGRYYSLFEAHEFRTNYGLNDAWAERAYYAELSALSESALGEFQSYQLQTRGQWLQNSLQGHFKKQSYGRSLRTPAAILGALVAAYTGRTLEFKVGEETLLRTRTIKNNSRLAGAAFGLDSQFINGGVELAPGGTGPGGDTYKANLSKGIASLGASAGVSYGLATQNTTVTVAKSLSRYLSVRYDHAAAREAPTNHVVGVGVSAGF